MVSMGLLGAVGGVGQAMQTLGQDMEKRRQTALLWAREEAKAMRERAQKQADKQEERQYDQGEWSRRNTITSTQQAEQNKLSREATRSNLEYTQGQQGSRQEDAQRHAENMAKLQNSLSAGREAQNEATRQRNRIALKKLDEGNPRGIIWADDTTDDGKPTGKQRAFKIWDDGRQERTGFVRTPRARDDDSTDSNRYDPNARRR